MVKLTGLWAKKAKDGSNYMTGKLGIAKLILFKNKHKQSEKDPDFNLYVDEVKNDQQQGHNAPPPQQEPEW